MPAEIRSGSSLKHRPMLDPNLDIAKQSRPAKKTKESGSRGGTIKALGRGLELLAQSDTDGLSGSPHSGDRAACKGSRISSEGSPELSWLKYLPASGFDIRVTATLEPSARLYTFRHRGGRLCFRLRAYVTPLGGGRNGTEVVVPRLDLGGRINSWMGCAGKDPGAWSAGGGLDQSA